MFNQRSEIFEIVDWLAVGNEERLSTDAAVGLHKLESRFDMSLVE